MSSRSNSILVFVLSLVLAAPGAWAQVAPNALPSTSTIGREIQQVDPTTTTRRPEIGVPTGQRGFQVPPELMARSVTFHQVVIEGVTAFNLQDIDPLFAPILNKTVAFSDVVLAINRISAAYEQAGYAFYNVVLPQQDFNGDKLRIVVVEGHISRVDVEDSIKSAAVRERVVALVGKLIGKRPLKRAELERQLLLAADTPGANLSAGVRPDPAGGLGAVALVVGGSFERFSPIAQVDSVQTTPGTTVNLRAGAIGRSLLFGGDALELRYINAIPWERLHLVDARYGLPVGTDGDRLEFIGQSVWQRPITTINGQPADLLGRSLLGRLQYSHPFQRSLKWSWSGIGMIDVISVNYQLQGIDIPSDSLRVLRAGAYGSLIDGWDGQWGATVLASVGLDVLDARAPTRVGGAASFQKLNVMIQRAQPFGPEWTAIARASAQVATGTLPSSEVYSFGGRDFGRAFNVSESVGDHGVAVSGEMRWAPEWLRTYRDYADPHLYVYADYGRLWADNPLNAPFFSEGASAGAGVRIVAWKRATAEFELGKVIAGQSAYSSEPQPWRFSFRVGTAF